MEFSHPCTDVFVEADPMRLKQVMVNLLSNAIKYNRTGGTVSVTCGVPCAHHLRVEVQDTGNGMAAHQLSQLFEPFNRLGQESSMEEGTGIGLAVSRRLMEAMGGTIGANSAVGVGSVFWIELRTLPASRSGAPIS
jgi:signal transduction histidine kinase